MSTSRVHYRNQNMTPLLTLRTHTGAVPCSGLLSEETQSVRLLLRKGASFSRPDGEHKVPLHAAAQSRNVRCVETLFVAGSNVHTRGLHGDAAIRIAAWADDNSELLETIFLAGASLNAKNKNGSTP